MSRVGKWNSGAMMPMIVYGLPSSCTVLPITRESPPNCVCHSSWLMTSDCPATVSDGENNRPANARAPRVGKRSHVTCAVSIRLGSPDPARFTAFEKYAPIDENDLDCAL